MPKTKRSPANPRVPKRVATALGVKRKRRPSKLIMKRIIEAASGEFKRRGFAGATTAAIARKADVTEAQLFRYFRSKALLFRETIFNPLERHISEFIKKQSPAIASITDRDATTAYTSELQAFISEHMEMLTSLVVAETYNAGAAEGVGQIDSLRAYFEHGAASVSARVGGKPKIDPKLYVRVSFAAVLGCVMFKSWIFPPGLASDDKIRKAINDFVMDGLSVNFPRA